MRAGLDGSGRFQTAVFNRFLLSVDLGLDNNRVALAVRAWVDAEQWVRGWAESRAEWARDAALVWDEFLAKREARDLKTCPCGKLRRGGGLICGALPSGAFDEGS